MTLKKSFLVVVLVFQTLCFLGQERTFGDVSIPELKQTSDAVFTDAPAVVLYRDVDFAFGKVLHIHERIKIYNSEGFEYSDWTIPFNDVKALKAATYNLENGKIEVIKVSKNGIFKEEVSEDEEIRKLTFPGIKEGSIIELKYKVTFIGLSKLYTQGFLPIKYQRVKVTNGHSGELSVRDNPYVQLPIRRVDGAGESIFIGENIPPLKLEKFVSNLDNHRGKIMLENYGRMINQTWSNVAKMYDNAEWFGVQLEKGDVLYKRQLKILLAGETNPLEKAKKIDRYIKKNIEWNKEYSRGSEYVKTIYRDKIGDSGDINLLLVHMLRSVGLKADPILIATKNRGWIMYPKFNAFNAVLATVVIDDKRYILDASNKDAAFAQVPIRYINNKGLIVYNDGTYLLHPLKIEEMSKETVLVNAELDIENAVINGEVKERMTNYFALEHREYYTNLKEDTYEEYLNEIDYFDATNVEVKNVENTNSPIDVAFNFKLNESLENIGGSIYFEPLLIWGLKQNDFNEDDRLYPIDLDYPTSKNYIINYTIPKGYTVESLPEAKLITIRDNIGSFKFNIAQRGNRIQVIFSLEFNDYLIPANYYAAIKELYSEFLQISKTKIALTKTTN